MVKICFEILGVVLDDESNNYILRKCVSNVFGLIGLNGLDEASVTKGKRWLQTTSGCEKSLHHNRHFPTSDLLGYGAMISRSPGVDQSILVM